MPWNTQPWDGVAVAALLARPGVQPAARFLKVSTGDYTVLLLLEEALAGGALLARALNGQPQPLAHGAGVLVECAMGGSAGEGLVRARLQR